MSSLALLNGAVLLLAALGTWWLTGLDKTNAGESIRSHYLVRLLGCLVVVFLVALLLWVIEDRSLGYFAVPLVVVIPVSIALVLRSSLSEVFAHGFLRMVDPALHDQREFDPKKAQRYQDAIAHLIHAGKTGEAIKLCAELKQSGEVDLVTINNTLAYLGVQVEHLPAKPLAEASRLRTARKFAEAEELLKSLLLKNPADDAAAIMLMRLYAEDLHQPERAHEVLQALEQQPHVPKEHLDFARNSIAEWSHSQPPSSELVVSAPPPSLDDLLAQGCLGTAIEMLEARIKAQPSEFEPYLKLATVYAVNCKSLPQAEKLIRRLELSPHFSAQQIAQARFKLKEWQAWPDSAGPV